MKKFFVFRVITVIFALAVIFLLHVNQKTFMAQLPVNEFAKWFDKNPNKLSEIFTAKREGFAKAIFKDRKTKLGAAIVYMVDPSNTHKLLETFLVALSDEEVSKESNLIPEDHLGMVNDDEGNGKVSELLLQISKEYETIDYFLREVPTLPKP